MGVHGKLLWLILVAILSWSSAPQSLPGCPERCGDVAIRYPFGIGDECCLEPKFNMTCDDPEGPAPKAYLGTGNINIIEIFVEPGELRVLQYVARDCYLEAGPKDEDQSNSPSIWFSSFTVSPSRNKFFAVGCDTYAIVRGHNRRGQLLTTGCMSLCDGEESIANDSCSGTGCCEVTIPAQLKNQTMRLSSYYNHTGAVWGFNPCSYAFTVESGVFNFSGVSSFKALETVDMLPMIVDWFVGDQPCAEASGNSSYHCKGNSRCEDSNTGIGYLCKCLPGYQGNPYHPDGCEDIDECQIGNHCNGTCKNMPGNYSCSCDKGFLLTNGTLCVKDVKNSGPAGRALAYLLSGVSAGIVALVFASSMIFWVLKKRKLIRQREKFFEKNGGLMLQRRLSSVHDKRGSFETAKIFTEEELIRATNNYNHVLGEGGYGIVYKGKLPDKRMVAVKKPKLGAQGQTQQQTEQFVNEVMLLMQINHRNVVRLLGCCLDTEVPILVYEFIANGTLFERIHKRGSSEEEEPPLSWESRLRIATETTGALAYLHSETNTPIFHRDIKSMNILLDENYTAKVSDFGTSRLVPLDQEELSTLVQGTIGYLDPEYLQTNQLTDKSDVYSLGVVLAELITGKRPFCCDKSEGTTSNLAMSFLSLRQDDQLLRIIDEDIDFEANAEAIREVVSLAKRCLMINGEQRPTMKEVAMELEGLRAMSSKNPWGKVDNLHVEENEYLLGSPSIEIQSGHHDVESGFSGANSIVYGMENKLIFPYNDGR